MKRILLAAFIAITFFAVEGRAQHIQLGVRAGGTAATWQGDAIDNANSVINLANIYVHDQALTPAPRAGFHAGVYASIPVGQRVEIEPGVFYSQKGSQVSGQFSSEKYDFVNLRATLTNKLNYIDVPVLARVYVTDGLHFFAGPQVSFLVSNKLNTRLQVAGFSLLNRDWNLDPGYQKIDVAASAGMGYKFENGFNLTAGYDHGLNRLTNMENLRAYNRAVKVSVGYEF
jgi:hypothetical protein